MLPDGFACEDRDVNAFETDLQQLLVVARPATDWVSALRKASLDGPDVWRQEDPESWPMSGPPEEYALPPLVWWPDELRRLAEKAYRASYDRFLDPGESYEFGPYPRIVDTGWSITRRTAA